MADAPASHTRGAERSASQLRAQPIDVGSDVTIQPPLTRRGHGPPLLLIIHRHLDYGPSSRTLDPPPLVKWAEEGFCVAQVQVARVYSDEDLTEKSYTALGEQVMHGFREVTQREECDTKDSIGLVCKRAYHRVAREQVRS
jgi:carboxymethylenebutenolidase